MIPTFWYEVHRYWSSLKLNSLSRCVYAVVILRRWVPPYTASLFINTLAQPTIWPVATARCLLATTATAGGQNYHTQVSQVHFSYSGCYICCNHANLSGTCQDRTSSVIHNYYTLHVHTCNNTIGANPEEY